MFLLGFLFPFYWEENVSIFEQKMNIGIILIEVKSNLFIKHKALIYI